MLYKSFEKGASTETKFASQTTFYSAYYSYSWSRLILIIVSTPEKEK